MGESNTAHTNQFDVNNLWLGRVARVLQAERGQIWTGRSFKLSKHRWPVLANYLVLTRPR
jgi:hypothetical protein